ncbi:MAG: ATP-binding protein, partial [Caldisericia bacterium]|nr:ATP-binding protein [Caldisericia bacterium]
GLFCQSIAFKRSEYIKDIPRESIINIRCLEFEILPKEIITIPIVSLDQVVAVVTISSLEEYSEVVRLWLDASWAAMSARFNSVLSYRRIQDFSETLEKQNEEIEEQKNELSRQSFALQEQNINLENQKKQLQELNQLKTTFLSNMSHELRTPLNSIIALSGVLLRRYEKKPSSEETTYLQTIEKSGKNLLGIINDMLILSKMEAGKEELNISTFSVTELIQEVLEIVTPQAKDKHLSIHSDIPEKLYITSDMSKLRHIIQNLFGNAVKFTEQGEVSVKVYANNKFLFIEVRDTGIGIAKEHLPFIFEEFSQVDESFSKKYDGTGLGLAIAKRYTEMLKGEIHVESTPGKGSLFLVTMPISLDRENQTSVELTKHKQATDVKSSPIDEKQSKIIVIIEDSDPATIQLKDILQREGYQILSAQNGVEGLQLIEQRKPDGIILDLMMPEMDGFEVLKTLRSNPAYRDLPVLILTAKHISREELDFLHGNHIYQLIQKGDVSKYDLLKSVESMIFH